VHKSSVICGCLTTCFPENYNGKSKKSKGMRVDIS
jgi:hypothetical protein